MEIQFQVCIFEQATASENTDEKVILQVGKKKCVDFENVQHARMLVPQLGVVEDTIALPKGNMCLKRSAAILGRHEVLLTERSPTQLTWLEQDARAEGRA